MQGFLITLVHHFVACASTTSNYSHIQYKMDNIKFFKFFCFLFFFVWFGLVLQKSLSEV